MYKSLCDCICEYKTVSVYMFIRMIVRVQSDMSSVYVIHYYSCVIMCTNLYQCVYVCVCLRVKVCDCYVLPCKSAETLQVCTLDDIKVRIYVCVVCVTV